jgi:hypothetical protein
MTVPHDSISRDPADPLGSGRVGEPAAAAPNTAGKPLPTAPAASPVANGSPTPTPTAPSTTPSTPAGTGSPTESGRGAKVKAAALVAGAAALVNKLRKEAPKRAREVRQKRIAGRCILLTEIAGHPVAIGPYRDEQAARHDLTRVTGAPQVLELKSQAAYFGTPGSDPTVTPTSR